MEDKKKNKICFILHTITSLLFTLVGITILVTNGIVDWRGITGIALGVTFGSIAYMYFKNYKEEK